mmetsp:Transcript_27129/g.86346  ORF Transcript_27129/g.86346 Transcript_27129/m.86346 type:complete len:222 (-) Transcript_27129:256-921(-)
MLEPDRKVLLRREHRLREGVHAEAHLPAACAQLAVAAQQPPQVVAGAGTSLHPAAARRHPAGATVQRRSPHLDPERRHSPRRREEPRRRAHRLDERSVEATRRKLPQKQPTTLPAILTAAALTAAALAAAALTTASVGASVGSIVGGRGGGSLKAESGAERVRAKCACQQRLQRLQRLCYPEREDGEAFVQHGRHGREGQAVAETEHGDAVGRGGAVGEGA